MAKKYLDISGLTYFWGKISTALGGKQDTLVSGTNIKTVNNQSLLGSGNISVGGGGGLTFDDVYPVGSIYMSVSSTSPATLFGGTWVQIEDTFLLASGTTYSAGATGGEAEHTLTEAQLPNISGTVDIRRYQTSSGSIGNTAHNASGHFSASTASDSTSFLKGTVASNGTTAVTFEFGSGAAHNNMPPYLAVYMWKRTA